MGIKLNTGGDGSIDTIPKLDIRADVEDWEIALEPVKFVKFVAAMKDFASTQYGPDLGVGISVDASATFHRLPKPVIPPYSPKVGGEEDEACKYRNDTNFQEYQRQIKSWEDKEDELRQNAGKIHSVIKRQCSRRVEVRICKSVAGKAAWDGIDPKELIKQLGMCLTCISQSDPLTNYDAMRRSLTAVHHLGAHEDLTEMTERIHREMEALNSAAEKYIEAEVTEYGVKYPRVRGLNLQDMAEEVAEIAKKQRKLKLKLSAEMMANEFTVTRDVLETLHPGTWGAYREHVEKDTAKRRLRDLAQLVKNATDHGKAPSTGLLRSQQKKGQRDLGGGPKPEKAIMAAKLRGGKSAQQSNKGKESSKHGYSFTRPEEGTYCYKCWDPQHVKPDCPHIGAATNEDARSARERLLQKAVNMVKKAKQVQGTVATGGPASKSSN